MARLRGAKRSVRRVLARAAPAAGLMRTSEYLTHPIFHMNRAESEMTRYMRRLADRDLASTGR